MHCVVHNPWLLHLCRSAISFLLPLVFLFIFERFFLNCRIVITYWNAHTRNQHFVSGKILRCSPFYARKNLLASFFVFLFSWKHAEQKLIINIKIFYYNHIIVLTPHNIMYLFLCVKSLVCLCFCFGCIFSLKWNQWKELVHKSKCHHL